MSEWPRSLVLVGAGKMGEALLRGWLAGGLAPARVTILEPKPSPAIAAVAAEWGIALNPPLAGLAAPDALFLAIKPQTLEAAAPDLAPLAGAEHAGRSRSWPASASPISRRGCRARARSCASCPTRPPRSAAAPPPPSPVRRRARASANGRKA